MTRLLLIPLAGTIAALAMIAWARQPREQKDDAHPDLSMFDADAPDHGLPDDEMDEEAGEAGPDDEEPAPEPQKPAKEPEPTALEFLLRLDADGSFFDTDTRATYASIDDLVKEHGAARHTLVLTNGVGVDRAKLDEVEALLRDRFTVRKVYRAAETPPGEGR